MGCLLANLANYEPSELKHKVGYQGEPDSVNKRLVTLKFCLLFSPRVFGKENGAKCFKLHLNLVTKTLMYKDKLKNKISCILHLKTTHFSDVHHRLGR